MKHVVWLIAVLLLQASCRREEAISGQCYADNPVQEIPWFGAAVKEFQQPKSGPLLVASYKYRKEVFLVISNPAVSSPASYVFNCSGQNIGQLGIHYNAFMNEARVMSVFLDEKY